MTFDRSATAATITWTGTGGTGDWSTAGNWNPNTALGINTNDVLQFNGTTGLLNTNDVNGITNAGIVFLPGAGAFTLNAAAGVTTYLNGNIVCQSTNLETFDLGLKLTGTRIIEPENGVNAAGMIFNGAISQTASSGVTFYPAPAIFNPVQGLANNGGTAIFSAANTYSGATAWAATSAAGGYATNEGAGTLILNFAAGGAPLNNILYNGITPGGLTMAGGALVIQGAANVTNAQVVGAITMGPGVSTIQVIDGAGTGNAVFQCGAFNGAANGNNEREAILNFILPAGTQNNSNGITTTAVLDANIGIFTTSTTGRHFADFVVNGTSWATLGGASGTNIVGLPDTGYLTDLTTAFSNQDVTASGTLLASPSTSGAVGTLRFNTPSPITLTVNNTQYFYGAAILMTTNCGTNVQTIAGNGPGTALYGDSFNGLEGLNILQFNTNAPLVLTNIYLLDGGQLNVGGGGEVILASVTNNSTANPCVSVMGGELTIYQNDSLGATNTGGGIQLNNGILCVAATLALDANNGGGLHARQIALGNLGGTFCVLGTNTLTVSGTFLYGNSGAGASGGSVAKTGTGTLVLTAPDSYPAPTIVEQGTLTIAGGLSGGSALVVSDGATLVDQGAVSITTPALYLGSTNGCTNTFAGISSLTTAPIQTTTLDASGTNVINITGVISAAGVYPLISFTNNIGTGSFVVGTLPADVVANVITNITGGSTNIALHVTSVPIPVVWKGNVSSNWDDTTANWTFNSGSVLYSDGDAVQFNDTAAVFNVNLATNVSPGSIFVTNSQNAYTFSGMNGILAGSLTKTGTNTLTLAVTDSSAAGITISEGALVVGDGTTNGAVTAGTIVDDSVLEFAETNGSCLQSISGSGTVIINAANNVGSGVYVLGGANSYLGNSIIEGGTLEVVNASSIPDLAGGGILMIVDTNAELDVNGVAVTVNGLSGNGLVDNLAHPEVALTIGANNTNSTFAGTLTNTTGFLDIVKTGTGTLSLTGTNYNGGLFEFNSGIVNAAFLSDYADAGTPNAGPSAIGQRNKSQETSGSISLLFAGGTLQYTGSTPQETDRQMRWAPGNACTIDASGANFNATMYWSFGDTEGANINLFETPGTRTLTLTGSNTGTNTFDIQITDQAANATSVVKSGAGTWYLLGGLLAGPNSYSGSTAVNQGTLVISTTHNDSGGSVSDANGVGPFTVANSATLGVTDGGNSNPAYMGALTVGSSAGGTLEFLNIPPSGVPMMHATGTVFHGSTIVCATNNLAAGNVYPLLAYGTLTGSYTLAAMPGPLYYQLSNDTVNLNIDLVASSTPLVNTNSTNIFFSLAGNQLTLSWPADHTGWTLQAQSNAPGVGIGTNWINVAGSTSTNQIVVPIVSTNGSVFFRMVYP